MKSKYISISILTAALLATAGCGKKFLDKQPIATTIDVTFYQTDAQLVSGVNAVYDPLNWYQADAKSSGTIVGEFIWGDICSDDALGGGDNAGDPQYSNVFGNFNSTANTPQLASVWKNQYIGIRRANIIIEKAPLAKYASDAMKNRVIAEAKFLRAYYHFYLYRMFGPVPYITKQLQPGEFEQAKTSKDQYFTNLIQDLKDAASVLPYKYSGNDLGRATKGAALGYLTRVYLFKGDSWSDVLSNAEQIIGDSLSNGYNLKTPYETIHSTSTEYGSESVFEIGATSNGPVANDRDNEGTYFDKLTGPRGQLKLGGYGLIAPSDDLMDEFKADSAFWVTKIAQDPTFYAAFVGKKKMDPRRKATIAAPGDTVYGTIIALAADGNANAKYYKRKYVNDITITNQTQGPSNIRLIRMSDIYLMAAEAAFRSSDEVKAITYVNAVRKRVNMPLIKQGDSDFTSDKLINAIWKERRLELALESIRFFDIVRQGRAATIFANIVDPSGEGKNFKAGKNEVFPIPQTEIDLSGGKISQNPNY